MADADAAMALALVDGHALLTVAARDLGPAVVERSGDRVAGASPPLPEDGRRERLAPPARAAARRDPVSSTAIALAAAGGRAPLPTGI